MDPQNPFNPPEVQNHDHEESQEVVAERLIADAGQSQAMYNFSQKVLEQKERELMESIAMNYGRIREVERELGNLQLQLKLTSGPKKQALEMLRKKIETQNEKVVYIRTKHTAAKATYERLDAELKQEEAAKDQLCGELNMLVQQAARAQLDKLEELKTTLEGLYGGYAPKQAAPPRQQQQAAASPAHPPPGGATSSSGGSSGTQPQQEQREAGSGAAASSQSGEEQQRQEQERQEQERQEQERQELERRRREAEAAAARSRHVSLNPGSQAPGPRAAGAGNGRQAGPAVTGPTAGPTGPSSRAGAGAGPTRARAANEPSAGTEGVKRFAGFDT